MLRRKDYCNTAPENSFMIGDEIFDVPENSYVELVGLLLGCHGYSLRMVLFLFINLSLCHHFLGVKFINTECVRKSMRTGLTFALLGLVVAFGLLISSSLVSALWSGWGMTPAMMGSAYGYGAYSPSYGYGSYGPSYGYAGPYSYHFVPRSFWGHYYNPGLYYSTLDYASRNSQYVFSQGNLGMTYGFISQPTRLY